MTTKLWRGEALSKYVEVLTKTIKSFKVVGKTKLIFAIQKHRKQPIKDFLNDNYPEDQKQPPEVFYGERCS